MDKPPKKLSSSDIQNLVEDNEKLKSLPSVNIFGLTIDIQSLNVSIIGAVLWILLWFYVGIFNIVPYAAVFFILYLVINIITLINSATNVSDIESERMNISSQQNFIQGAISIFILALVFLYHIKMDEKNTKDTYKVLIICLMVGCMAIVLINVKNISKNVRFIRKIQQMIYNQALVLFLLALFMIYRFQATKKI